MAKIIVIIENTEDGQPIWDEASIKQLHDIIRPGTTSNHRGRRDDYDDVLLHYSSHRHKTNDDGETTHPQAANARKASDSELKRELPASFIEYQFEA